MFCLCLYYLLLQLSLFQHQSWIVVPAEMIFHFLVSRIQVLAHVVSSVMAKYNICIDSVKVRVGGDAGFSLCGGQ